MLISAAFDAYVSDVIAMKNQSAKTEENHYVCMRALLSFFSDIDIESLDFARVRDWKLDLDKSRSAETVRNYVIRLRVVLDYCHSQGMNVLVGSTIPVPKRTDKVPSFISPQEVALLMAGTKKLRNKAIISFLYASGIRVSELCSLNREEVRDKSFTVVGKGGKARLCFIDDRTQTLLDIYLEERDDNNPALFISDNFKIRMTTGGVQEVFKYARRGAGFTKPVHPHTMRHSFATNLLRNNANLRYVQAMLGHSSLETTQMYTHVVDADLQRIHAEYHSI